MRSTICAPQSTPHYFTRAARENSLAETLSIISRVFPLPCTYIYIYIRRYIPRHLFHLARPRVINFPGVRKRRVCRPRVHARFILPRATITLFRAAGWLWISCHCAQKRWWVVVEVYICGGCGYTRQAVFGASKIYRELGWIGLMSHRCASRLWTRGVRYSGAIVGLWLCGVELELEANKVSFLLVLLSDMEVVSDI